MVHHRTVTRHPPDLEERVLEVLERWDRRLEIATAAWARLSGAEQRRREAALDAAGETEEWVVVLWDWWARAGVAEQAQLRRDVALLSSALGAAAAGGYLDGPSEAADSARHLLGALDRLAAVLRLD